VYSGLKAFRTDVEGVAGVLQRMRLPRREQRRRVVLGCRARISIATAARHQQHLVVGPEAAPARAARRAVEQGYRAHESAVPVRRHQPHPVAKTLNMPVASADTLNRRVLQWISRRDRERRACNGQKHHSGDQCRPRYHESSPHESPGGVIVAGNAPPLVAGPAALIAKEADEPPLPSICAVVPAPHPKAM
jgi:hypothetical protein